MDNSYKEVKFNVYCKQCKHGEKEEKMDPCNDCLNFGMNNMSEKPVYFEDKNKEKR